VQKVSAALTTPEGPKSPCEIIADLSGNAISYKDTAAIFNDIKANIPAFKDVSYEQAQKADGAFIEVI
jgi:predicted molibdopterin-dependent oxidoreductase YjgC